MSDSTTIVALATPLGSSALAVIRLSGASALSFAKDAFGTNDIKPRKAYYGAYKSVSGKVLDECVWIPFFGPNSYTGEDTVEISCHGNPFIIERVIGDLLKRGCRSALPGEFTRRAFINGKMDLTQAEAVAEIISAQSERAFDAARKLLSGELGRRIFEWNDDILKLIAEAETQIDFTEEEIPEINGDYFKSRIDTLVLKLRKTRETSRYSSRVYKGVNVVIFGAPNAGKSSLMNALVGAERALVSDEAGTTRDFISEDIVIGKNCIRIIDTAGIRSDAGSEIEKSGIIKTYDCMRSADFLIFVVDSSVKPPVLDEFISSCISKDNTCIVFNKNDLDTNFQKDCFLPDIDRISISLLEPSSHEVLKKYLDNLFNRRGIVPDSDVLIVSSRHAESILMAENLLLEASELVGKLPIEFVSSKLRAAIEELSEILGQFDNERVLDKVFSSFCIGK